MTRGCRSKNGETPLHYAVREGFPDCCRLLLEYGAARNVLSTAEQRRLDVMLRTGAAPPPVASAPSTTATTPGGSAPGSSGGTPPSSSSRGNGR